MELRLNTSDLEEACKQYIGKLGFDLSHSSVNVVISQTKIATVEITPKKTQVEGVPTIKAADLTVKTEDEVKPEPADSENIFKTSSN